MKKYASPTIELNNLGKEDIITTSGQAADTSLGTEAPNINLGYGW